MIVHISPFDFTTGLIDEDNHLTNVISASIERDATDETSLLESATVKLDTSDFARGWYAVDAIENSARHRLGVFYFKLKTLEQGNNGVFTYELEGVSTLYEASTEYVANGYSVRYGDSGADVIEELLKPCTAPLNITAFQVAKSQVFSADTTRLGACWSILRNAGMCMQISDNGTINVIQPPTDIAKTITASNGVLLGTVSISDDEVGYECAVSGRPYDRVTINLPKWGVNSTLRIASQSIDLTKTSLTAEETLKEQVYDG